MIALHPLNKKRFSVCTSHTSSVDRLSMMIMIFCLRKCNIIYLDLLLWNVWRGNVNEFRKQNCILCTAYTHLAINLIKRIKPLSFSVAEQLEELVLTFLHPYQPYIPSYIVMHRIDLQVNYLAQQLEHVLVVQFSLPYDFLVYH